MSKTLKLTFGRREVLLRKDEVESVERTTAKNFPPFNMTIHMISGNSMDFSFEEKKEMEDVYKAIYDAMEER